MHQDWHTIPLDEIFQQLQTSPQGLTQATAQQRWQQLGPNQLPQAPPVSLGQVLWRQLCSPLIYILALAALVSYLVGDWQDAGFILAVLVINALIGGYQEWRAEQSSRALQQLLKTGATVVRDGEVYEVDATALVPGDLVWLESGNRVPADLRLIYSHNLEVDESLLTGESLTVLKAADWQGSPHSALSDRLNIAYAGSIVVRGRGRGLVVRTGAATTMGQLALDMIVSVGGQPPLLKRMARFSQVIAVGVVGVAVTIGLLGVVRHGYSLLDMFMLTIALIVSAIPEGLPVAITIALSVATHRLARRGVIVRQLPAVEGLGSCTLIASDKTGTLTCNELTVREIYLPTGEHFQVSGEGFTPLGEVLLQDSREGTDYLPLQHLARAAVLCNEADLHHRDGQWIWRGDPTDIALLTLAHKLGWQREQALNLYPQVNEIPFEPEHQFAATYHPMEGQMQVMVKGAPERVLTMCDGSPQVTAAGQWAETMAGQGYRVLALAAGQGGDRLDQQQVPDPPSGLALLGLVGMIDPLRPGVKPAIAQCHRAGIGVWMITGDHPITARAIAQDLGLGGPATTVVTGAQLERLDSSDIQHLLHSTCVFARVAPHQKLLLVEAAQTAGHFVAVTGDGVNDATALRAANIGVAMGKSGTDVAREAADLVISDDNFATLVAGVEEGRIAYDNVRKVIYLLVSTGAAEIVLVGLAVVTGLPLPLLPVQLLWLNLVTNGIQHIGLAFEPGTAKVLQRPPRSPREPIFNALMVQRTLLAAAVMGGVGFSLFSYLLAQPEGNLTMARSALLLLMVLFENVHVGNCRCESTSALRLSPLRNPILVVGTLAAFTIHAVVMHRPVGQGLLSIRPVPLETWGLVIPLSLTVLVAIEVDKRIRSLGRRR